MAETDETLVEDADKSAEEEEETSSRGAEEEGETEEEGADSEAEESDEDESLDPDRVEPEVRKTPYDYIKARKERKRGKEEHIETETEEEEAGEGDAKFKGELTPAAREYLDRVAADAFKRISSPMFETLAVQEGDREVNAFLASAENSHFKRYERVVRKYMEHPAYRQVPVERIFYMLDYKNAMLRGAEGRKDSDAKVKKTRMSGDTSRRSEGAGPDVATLRALTPAQYKKLRDQIEMGKVIESQS